MIDPYTLHSPHEDRTDGSGRSRKAAYERDQAELAALMTQLRQQIDQATEAQHIAVEEARNGLHAAQELAGTADMALSEHQASPVPPGKLEAWAAKHATLEDNVKAATVVVRRASAVLQQAEQTYADARRVVWQQLHTEARETLETRHRETTAKITELYGAISELERLLPSRLWQPRCQIVALDQLGKAL